LASIGKKKSGRNSYNTEDITLQFVESKPIEIASGKSNQIPKNQLQRMSMTLASIETLKLSIVQRLILHMGGVISIGIQQPDSYSPTEFFLRRCRKHGIIVSYPQGYLGKLRCDKCLQERGRNDEHDL
jgi:hypothetical protein